jgi:hypothetical protein
MNIVKGIDRIALVLAIIMGILIGLAFFLRNISGKYNYEYGAWVIRLKDKRVEVIDKQENIDTAINFSYEEREKYKREKYEKEWFPEFELRYWGTEKKGVIDFLGKSMALDRNKEYQNLLNNPPLKFIYPHPLKILLLSIGIAIGSFIAVLLFISGTTRGLKLFFLWVIKGFKDEKKKH